ncbi:hypothetical protein V8C40DRAFT_254667 [Trichoderma camerunense]
MIQLRIMQAVNSCGPCGRGKRRCDRGWPSCSTCTRLNRPCVYDKDTLRPVESEAGLKAPDAPTKTDANSSRSYSPQSSRSATDVWNSPSFTDVTSGVEPFLHDSLRRPTVDVIVQKQLLKIVKSRSEMHRIADTYFATIARRISIISAQRFYARLPKIESPSCAADFAALCLCVHLVLQLPQPHDSSMQSSLYVTVKGIISLLEATSFHSLEVIQCRILIAFYEIGHGTYPAAAASIGGCAKMARFAGFHRHSILSTYDEEREIVVEEKKRTLWALHNLDRYLNLSMGESIFTTPFAHETDPLPIEEDLWAKNIAPSLVTHNLNTPADVSIGSFARECQISHLVGRVLRNVYEPVSDEAFQAKEAAQLEATMSTFIPLLQNDAEDFGKYCISFAICSSAIFTLYGCSADQERYGVRIKNCPATLAEHTALETTRYCRKLFGDEEAINYSCLSPFVPYALYQSAVIQMQLLQRDPTAKYEDNIEFLKQVLRNFGKRWMLASKYLLKLNEDSPPLLYSLD